MLLSPAIHSLSRTAIGVALHIPLFLLLCVTTGFTQKAQPEDSRLPKCDLHTETKSKGVVDEVKQFQEEMGTSFSKGGPDCRDGFEGEAERMRPDPRTSLFVKGTNTLPFGDDKGNPVWDWRTGK